MKPRVDIGSVIDFWHATRLVLLGNVNGYRLPGREIFPAIRTGLGVRANWDKIWLKGPVYIGSGTSIGDGALIEGPTMIGPNCVIEAGAQIRQSIVGDYTRVSNIASLEERIVFAGKIIDPYGEAIDIQEADIGWLLDDARKEQHVNPLQSTLQALGTARAGT